MKPQFFAVFFGCLLIATDAFPDGPPPAPSAVWLESYDKAIEQAKKQKKPILMDFTGSDWCGWCIKLDEEVFNQKEFREYARQNLILLKVDFPRRHAQDAGVKKQNEELAARFDVQGFPTVLVINADAKVLGQLGYMEGGPAAFIAELRKIK